MSAHKLAIVDPGHFHAALTLRVRNPQIDDDIHVFAEDGPDLENFLRLVHAFNDRAVDPTRWTLYVYRGADYIEKVAASGCGDVAIVAGRNDRKMSHIRRLQASGYHVLGDKPWLIEGGQAGVMRQVLANTPACMDIMTERHEVTNRLLRAFARRADVFGAFHATAREPAISIRSVHHLHKLVNGKSLQRPAWYFNPEVQGGGVTDVTTHLVDLVQWLLGDARPLAFERDVTALAARQWPTIVPHETFARITGLANFPAALDPWIQGDALHYPCNAALSYRLRGVPVELEALWELKESEGSGDLHHVTLRGTRSVLVVDQGAATDYLTALRIVPVEAGDGFEGALKQAVTDLQGEFPGLGCKSDGTGYRIVVPRALRTTHEQHFAAVLGEFLSCIDAANWPANFGADMQCKYSLLAKARDLAHSGIPDMAG